MTVWPNREPELEGKTVFELDAAPMPEIIVEAASNFYVHLKEFDYFPNGFAW
jgi:hypothetical protein